MNTERKLYQWDTGQKLVGCTGLYVDFPIDNEVYRVETTDGTCIIPDELLQTSGGHKVYECMTNNTIRSFAFSVTPRPKPPDYVFTPTERLTFEGLVQKVDDAVADMIRRAESGEFDGHTPIKGTDYFTASEIQQIQNEVSSGAIGDFKSVVDTETEAFNNNAETKLTAYNQNDSQKTTAYNQNASEKTTSYNANATAKLNAYNTNANNRVAEFDSHTEQIQTDISELKSDLASLQTESYFFLKENFDIGSWVSYTLRVDESQVKYRIANKDGTFICFDNDTTIVARDGFRFFYKSEAEESDWSTVAKITENTNIVLTIARVTENTSETATVEEFISGVYLKSESKVKQEEPLQKNIFLNTFVKPNEVGTVSNYLIFSRTHHYPNKLCRIICENGYKVAYHKFSDSNLTDKLQDSGWLDNDYQFIMDNNYYQFLMRKDDYSTIGLEDESRAVAYIDDVFVNVNEFRKKDRYYPSFLVPSKANIVMHRGANRIAPENTIPAFEEGGKNKNVFGLECDVRCTSDKKYIIMHDETVDRTTNGSGSVYDMTFEQIRALNIDGGANIQDYPDLKVPTLEEYLLTCKKYGKVAVIELEYNSKNPKTYISDIIDIIKKCGMERSSILTSFEDYADSIRSCTRMIPFLLLLGSSATVSFGVYKGLCGGDNMGLNVDKQNLNLTKEVIQEIHYDDGIIAVYCPNLTTEFDIYADLGIDLITTDYLPQE